MIEIIKVIGFLGIPELKQRKRGFMMMEQQDITQHVQQTQQTFAQADKSLRRYI